MISLGWGFLACNALAMDGKHLGANGDTCITGGDERICMKTGSPRSTSRTTKKKTGSPVSTPRTRENKMRLCACMRTMSKGD